MRAEQILEEALRLDAERHYSIVTMRDVSKGCSIDVALIYYFDSKDVLFRRSIALVAERLDRRLSELGPSAADPLLEIGAYLSLLVEMAPMLADWVKIMADYAASSARDAETDAVIAAFYEREQALFEDCSRKGISWSVQKGRHGALGALDQRPSRRNFPCHQKSGRRSDRLRYRRIAPRGACFPARLTPLPR
ncbi:hypothetical protein Sa4125_02810 [Aureimonas sp. SA4125]|nr:hypothetical protein Sa4125_02810 [Aureimonas sp. SA4125]